MPQSEKEGHFLRRMKERERLDTQIALVRAQKAKATDPNDHHYLAREIQQLEALRDGTPAWEIDERRRKERMAFGKGTVEDWEIERERLIEAKLPTTEADRQLGWLREKRHKEEIAKANERMRGWRMLALFLGFAALMFAIGNCTRR